MATKQLSLLRRSTTDRLEDKENGMFIEERIGRPKILSRLLSFHSKESKTTVFVNEIDIGGMRLQKSPQILRSMKEEESGFDNQDEDLLPEAKQYIPKRARRFSSLFASDEEFSLSGEGDETKKQLKSRDDITTMVFKLFHVRNPRHGSKHKRNTSARSAASFKPRQQLKKEKKQPTLKLFWKQQKVNPQASRKTNNADTLSLTPAVIKRSKKSIRHRSISVCDSKFSSISSALSFTSLPQELIAITAQQSIILLHLLHKVTRSLHNQERLTANFSMNLAHLFARKERAIDGNKRLGKEVRKMLIGMMNGLRELVGRTFLKKAVLMKRSLQLCHDLEDMLSLQHDTEAVTSGGLEINDSETTLVRDGSPSLMDAVMAVTPSEPPSATSLCPPEADHSLDNQNFLHSLHVMREDIEVQRQLDQALRGGIVGPCEDVRFPATVNERVAMRRFVAFVDGSLGHLEGRYVQQGRVVRVLECLGGTLRDLEGLRGT